MPSVENLSWAKEKHNTFLSEKTAMGTCPAELGAISALKMVQQLQDTNIFQSCPPKPEHYKSKKKTLWKVLTSAISAPIKLHCDYVSVHSSDKQELRHLLAPSSLSCNSLCEMGSQLSL